MLLYSSLSSIPATQTSVKSSDNANGCTCSRGTLAGVRGQIVGAGLQEQSASVTHLEGNVANICA